MDLQPWLFQWILLKISPQCSQKTIVCTLGFSAFFNKFHHFLLKLFDLLIVFGRLCLCRVASDDADYIFSECLHKFSLILYHVINCGHYRFMEAVFFQSGGMFASLRTVLEAVVTAPHGFFHTILRPQRSAELCLIPEAVWLYVSAKAFYCFLSAVLYLIKNFAFNQWRIKLISNVFSIFQYFSYRTVVPRGLVTGI